MKQRIAICLLAILACSPLLAIGWSGIIDASQDLLVEIGIKPGQTPDPIHGGEIINGVWVQTGDRLELYSFANFQRLYLKRPSCEIYTVEDAPPGKSIEDIPPRCIDTNQNATPQEVADSEAFFAWQGCNLSGICQNWQRLLSIHPEWRWPDSNADKHYCADHPENIAYCKARDL